jgi:cyclic-di-GMP-binding protein
MASFDIVSKVDAQTLDNAVNVAYKEITNRFDFRDSQTLVELNKKDMVISIETENDMRLRSVEDILMTRAVKQGIDGRSFDFTKEAQASGKIIKKTIKVKAGLEKEDSKKIVKIIKDSKIKVDASIMDDQVRVTSKKIDDLQAVIALLRKSETGIPMQFINMKS